MTHRCISHSQALTDLILDHVHVMILHKNECRVMRNSFGNPQMRNTFCGTCRLNEQTWMSQWTLGSLWHHERTHFKFKEAHGRDWLKIVHPVICGKNTEALASEATSARFTTSFSSSPSLNFFIASFWGGSKSNPDREDSARVSAWRSPLPPPKSWSVASFVTCNSFLSSPGYILKV